MKRREKLAIDYAKKFKNWEHHIIAKDAFLIALETYLPNDLLDEVQVEFLDGSHQLTPLQFAKLDVE